MTMQKKHGMVALEALEDNQANRTSSEFLYKVKRMMHGGLFGRSNNFQFADAVFIFGKIVDALSDVD